MSDRSLDRRADWECVGREGEKTATYVSMQIKPRDDQDYSAWARLGVTHVCVDPPGNPHDRSLADLVRTLAQLDSIRLLLWYIRWAMQALERRA